MPDTYLWLKTTGEKTETAPLVITIKAMLLMNKIFL